ncbi:MAG TPA: aminotransferase class V-fold PLP-dependent enzyme [Planctomycetota bacterium]|nr:aminotransferase class V-fold PLP-dependent enzyme [Planctomycetota bacterium]
MGHPFPPPIPGVKARWTLDPDVVFLNHGSFGACPAAVLERQAGWRARMERQPVLFLGREVEPLLDAARFALAPFLGARPDDLAFQVNASHAVSAVLRALPFEPGEEILVSDHGYNACNNAARDVAERAGAALVVANVPFPTASEDQVVDAFLERVSTRTKLAVVDHVTSQTGLVWPIARLVRTLQQAGVDVLVDGAHAPGMVPLDLDDLGAAYYAGNLHKWVCAPKGAAFLHVRADRRERIRPLSVSHGLNSPRTDRDRFRLLFDWTGTCDPTPWLCVPDALRFLGDLVPGGVIALRDRLRATTLAARDLLCAALGVAPPSPVSMIGALAAIPLPAGPPASPEPPLYLHPMQVRLWERRRIEVPFMATPDGAGWSVRISGAPYNVEDDYVRLAGALIAEGAAAS